MSALAEIPGFYYDAAKNRYFRLLPNHAAPTTSFYTSASVQKQQQGEQRIEQQRVEELRRLKRRQASPLSSSPFIRCTLIRELGAVSGCEAEEARRRVYAGGLRERKLWDVGSAGKITAFTMTGGKGLVVGMNTGSVMVVPAAKNDDGGLTYDRAGTKMLHHFTSQVTSVCLSPNGMLMASCLGGQSSPSIFRTKLPEPDFEDSSAPGQFLTFSHSVRSIWTSAASSQTGDMVLGASTGAICIRGYPNDRESHHFMTGSDVFAAEFLLSTPSAFACGSRDGAMRVFDVRVRRDEGAANLVVRHASTITHIRHLNDMAVVVNGLQKCALYDLRYPHPASPSRAFAEPTRPTATYEKVNDGKGYMVGLGFDVCGVRKVMAVANEDMHVRLFSVESGDLLESALGTREFRHPCRGLKFGSEEAEGRVASIFAIDGPHLEGYEF